MIIVIASLVLEAKQSMVKIYVCAVKPEIASSLTLLAMTIKFLTIHNIIVKIGLLPKVGDLFFTRP